MSEPVELSRPFDVQTLGGGEVRIEIVASAEERAALARRFDLLALDDLRGALRVVGSGAGVVRVSGTVEAIVEQTCVVTLEPMRSTIRGAVERSFRERADVAEEPAEIELQLEEDEPDPLIDGRIDLGEVVAEQLGLEIDPFPRRPGAVFEPPSEASGEEGEGNAGPFARLVELKKRLGNEEPR